MLIAQISSFGQTDATSIVPVFRSGEAGYSCFRIPAVVRCNSNGRIGVLFEYGQNNSNEAIGFTCVKFTDMERKVAEMKKY
jgi:hypothetical protein